MKKIFETILILALCLGLASCGLLPSSNSEENQTVEENKNNSSTDSFEDEKGNDPYPARTTVTIDEWLLAMSISNYSFSLVGYETNDEGVLEQNNVSYAYCTPDKMFAYGVYEGEAYEEYTARIDGLDYNIYKTDSGYVAEEIVTYIMDTHIGEFIADEDEWKEIFERLSYDESTESYKGEFDLHGCMYSVEAGFVEGKLVNLKVDSNYEDGKFKDIYTFYAIGTTVVSLPEFSFAE